MASEKILTSQLELAQSIERLYSNYKKSKSRYNVSYLQTRFEYLETSWNEFKAQNKVIVQDCSKEEKHHDYFVNDMFSKIEETYLDFKTSLKEQLKVHEQNESLSITPSPQQQQQHAQQAVGHKTKLPPINLPRFSGNYREWMHFKDFFTSLIDQDAHLSDIEKHHYLRSSLSGEADQLLRHFDLTAVNYKKAWDTLQSRYSNKRVIANNLLNRFLNQKKLSNECATGLKELLDTTRECLNGLDNLDIKTEQWDAIVVHMMVWKLDPETHKGWEHTLGASRDLPTMKQFTEYLEGRFRAIEMIQTTPKKETQRREIDFVTTTQKPKNMKTFTTEVDTTCTYCNKQHYICHCTDFTKLEIEQRNDFVKNNGLCFNCLVKGHSIKYCRQNTSCKKCGRKHHTLLHRTSTTTTPMSAQIATTSTESKDDSQDTQVVSMNIDTGKGQVVLATAKIAVKDKRGEFHNLRTLVDLGSQATFITESVVQTLGLRKEPLKATVTGIGSSPIQLRYSVTLDIHNTIGNKHVTQVKAHVIKKLTHLLPSRKFNTKEWPELTQLELSDPDFHKPSSIDVLLGAEVYAAIILDGLHKHNSLIAQNSLLGWLVSGTASKSHDDLHTHNIIVANTLVEVDQLLRKFWETEEYTPQDKPMTKLDQQCEQHYRDTHTRNADGRYVVRLPFKNAENLGSSHQLAINRLLHMEKRFAHKPNFRKDYADFMDEYKELDHMEDVDPTEDTKHKTYHLPHHAVIRESSTTTKLRVVFDGTAKPPDGSALNEELLVGPPLQQDIRDLIVRWRQHKYCLVADIKKMFRQILISKEDADYQRIVWRHSPDQDIMEKRLLTFTYGTACAPYLAMRTLHQLADDEKDEFPELVKVVKCDFYADDLLTGASDESEVINLQKRITKLMSKGQFEMHKWTSNSPVVLKEILDDDKLTEQSLTIKMDDSIKALGIKWNAYHDVFELKFDVSDPKLPFTKTTVLSDIARAFDPLGFMGPIIVTAKMYLQKLWLCGVGWNDELPKELATEWSLFRDQLLNMETIQLNRWMNTKCDNTEKVEVHGFSDASVLAYSAVVYLRVINASGIHVSLVIAKTKVAPVKQVSVARLELCGAVLLSKLLKDVKISLGIEDCNTFAWTDSMIVLAWLRKNPNVWNTYVANRTTEILNVLSCDQWHHVGSADNPADCASRGISPQALKDCNLWWHGPSFLHESESISYTNIDIPDTTIEKKTKRPVCMLVANDEALSYLNRYSKLSKLVRVTAYIMRFANNCKLKARTNPKNDELVPSSGFLSVKELTASLNVCIRLSQESSFPNEMQAMKEGVSVSKSSKLCTLTPYLDDDNILRVCGRLHNALVSDDVKSPIILSSKCNLAKPITLDAHHRVLHGGPQITLNIIRKRYWIIGAKNLVKKVFRQCLRCFRQNPASITQLMGQLPPARVTPTKPFRCSGVDYAGPVLLKLYPGRCQRTCKAYICLFVCMVSKAIHLELVSDLSSAAFIAAFRRFTSRRGYCSDIWSDCATNFVGASKELDLMFKNNKSHVVNEISELLANDNTSWHFIAPGSPHIGGLWEAGVKSVKTHLKRVIGQTLLTFEEYSTLLTQVEACVNSRPLTHVSDSKDDPLPITPGHFLLGEAPITIPEDNLLLVRVSHLDRWQMIQRMLQSLWTRWSSEYLCTLQNRYKWSSKKPELDIDAVVLIKDERLPPGKWLLGRIIDKHPGKDGLTRVVTVKHKNGQFQRPITKICPLPLDS